MHRLSSILSRIDGRGYPLYKQLRGEYQFEGFSLHMVHVQGDPFAAPSKLAVQVPVERLGLAASDIANLSRRIGLEDGILRTFGAALNRVGHSRGSGKSGQWTILRAGQLMVPRTAVELGAQWLTVRFTVGLPAAGRKILGAEAKQLLIKELPEIVRSGLFECDASVWKRHADSNEDQDYLRELLTQKGWVSFIANGSTLARASGADDGPLTQNSIGWKSPIELEQKVKLPNAGEIKGTAIGQGVTLICGGGFHGKSTLLRVMTAAVYNHIPGDGRELCSSIYEAVSIRAEDGRSVKKVNISPFISGLPNQSDTSQFSTQNASGSTSQAANIVESLEMGALALFIDEDTTATNFMVRDRRMQELISNEQEPITAFVDTIRNLYEQRAVSIVLVVGGSGDYFDIADRAILMEKYTPRVVTPEVRRIVRDFPTQRKLEPARSFEERASRHPTSDTFKTSVHRAPRVRTHQTRTITFGEEQIDISLMGQLFDEGQPKTIGDWIKDCSMGRLDGNSDMRTICGSFESYCKQFGLFKALPGDNGDRVFVRRFELAAALNRLRSLQVR